jgi:hypothetical protein
MYFLKDDNITAQDLYGTDLTQLELEDQPFISQGNIELYDASVHTIQLYKQVDIPEMVSVFGKPFIVSTDTIRHYFGAVWPMYSSGNFDGPIIDVAPRFYPNDIVKISMHRSYSSTDNRFNDTIIQTLEDYGVLHKGISCSIDSVVLVKNDSINNTCKLTYKYTITNNDALNLYVFDPLKMPVGLFHYHHNGVYFISESKVYESTSGAQAPEEGADEIEWLIRLGSKQSVARTIEKSGYPYIPKGKYKCGLRFASPYTIAKSKRLLSDGRVWIGEISVNDSIYIE